MQEDAISKLRAELLAILEPAPGVGNVSFVRSDASWVDELLSKSDEDLFSHWRGLLYCTRYSVSIFDLETMEIACRILSARGFDARMDKVREQNIQCIREEGADYCQLDPGEQIESLEELKQGKDNNSVNNDEDNEDA